MVGCGEAGRVLKTNKKRIRELAIVSLLKILINFSIGDNPDRAILYNL